MAYKKIVVPLDGSKLAEIALSHVEEIAAGCNVAEIDLISVTETLKVRVPGPSRWSLLWQASSAGRQPKWITWAGPT